MQDVKPQLTRMFPSSYMNFTLSHWDLLFLLQQSFVRTNKKFLYNSRINEKISNCHKSMDFANYVEI